MKKLLITLFVALTASIMIHAQINPRAWHTNGQTWLIWTANQPALGTNTYDIYARPSLSTNLSQWTLLGRVLPQDWQATRLSDHTGASQWLVPRTNGQYRLATNEGLFVNTPHAAMDLQSEPDHLAGDTAGLLAMAGLILSGNTLYRTASSAGTLASGPMFGLQHRGRGFYESAPWQTGFPV